ncbi:MAG TPA: sugar phosphate isomerase/epimerase family protein [Kiritimatiellia bacterium]|nr:sugar phosphate isomerase/epimerase family protein [Kiritimatiellia bacterium]HRU70460.1 sugar phosphate isomerase/epimerase family protein [Kiritimatiellia bacterium]
MRTDLSRRCFMSAATAALGAIPVAATRAAAPAPASVGTFRYALNTATLRGYKLSLPEQIAVTAQAGYSGIEPWVSDIAKAVEEGIQCAALKRQCDNARLSVISAIGFAAWAVDDDTARAKGMEQMKRDMDLVAQLGGTHIAASPAGVFKADVKLDLDRAAERYRAVLELGRSLGVIPQLEFWGASANLSRLDQCLYVAARAGHPDACVLADAFHLYRGGSDAASLRLLSRSAAHCFHMNDYPAQPVREALKDSDRVWPGDGIAPLTEILAALEENRAGVWLSVELFNATYWQQPAAETARTGLEKMKAAVAKMRKARVIG